MTVSAKIENELLALQKAAPDGLLRAEKVLTWAKRNRSSALHKKIEWNQSKAAREYQLWQIRRLIQVHIVNEAGEPRLVSLSIDRIAPQGGYRAIDDVLQNQTLSNVMLQDALQEFDRMRVRYERVKELTSVWKEVDLARKHATKNKPQKKAAKKLVAA